MKLPDPNVCKTEHSEFWLWECKVDDPSSYPYMIKVAGKSFCVHPEKQKFVEKEEEK